MEVLLNLLWMLLALPAWWLWQRHARQHDGEVKRWQCLLALVCLLLLLFPVISASDDLIAMRSEMEDSPGSSAAARAVETAKANAADGMMHAVLPAMAQHPTLTMVGRLSAHASKPTYASTPRTAITGRAPPRDLV